MNVKTILLTLFLIAIVSISNGQRRSRENVTGDTASARSGTLKISVSGNKPEELPAGMKEVFVKLLQNNKTVDSCITDSTGICTFRWLLPGKYLVNASRYSYTSVQTETILVTENKTTRFNINMQPAATKNKGVRLKKK